MYKTLNLVFVLLLISSIGFCQTGLQIFINTKDSAIPIGTAHVYLMKEGIVIDSSISDKEGYVKFQQIEAGIYDVKSTYKGYMDHTVKNLPIKNAETIHLTIQMRLVPEEIGPVY